MASGTQNNTSYQAQKWTNLRFFTIGETGKNVDGTVNISWSKNEILGASDSSKFLRGDKTWSNELTGPFLVLTHASADKALSICRGSTTESIGVWVNDGYVHFDVKNDETTANIEFKLEATDTESGGGAGAQTSTVRFNGSSGKSTVVADYFTGALTGNVTGNVTGNASTATILSNTPNNTTTFLRGDNTWSNVLGGAFQANGTITANGGYLQSTANSHTVRFGCQNSGWCHFTGGPQYYFDQLVRAIGSIGVYNTNHYIDGTAVYAYRWRTTNLELAELDANRMGLCNHGQATAKGLNVGSLLISNAWADASKVPSNGLWCRGNIVVNGANTTGGGIILSDDGDIVDLNDGYCAMRFSYGVRIFSAKSGGSAVITLGSNGNISASKVYNAVWNDYAECRQAYTEKPGYCVTETREGKMILTTERLQAGCKLISDTYGTLMGETKQAKTPIAVAGRVLAYPYRNRYEYPLGAAVCSAPNGMVDIMTRDEIMMYPERIVGTVSEIPDYEIWHGGSKELPKDIEVKGRIWIYVH